MLRGYTNTSSSLKLFCLLGMKIHNYFLRCIAASMRCLGARMIETFLYGAFDRLVVHNVLPV